MLEIYVLGGLKIFYGAFAGLAMLFDAGNSTIFVDPSTQGGWGSGPYLAALLGLLGLALTGVHEQNFRLDFLLVGLLAYVLFFVPKQDVIIIDLHGLEAGHIVEGVPQGVAFAAHITTTLAKNITESFQTAYTVADASVMPLTTKGFANPLHLLLASRSLTAKSIDSALNTQLEEYWQVCVKGAVENGMMLMSEIEAAEPIGYLFDPDLVPAFPIADILGGTGISNCKTVSTGIRDALLKIGNEGEPYNSALMRYVSNQMSGKGVIAPTMLDVDSAINMMGAASVDSQTFMANLVASNFHRAYRGVASGVVSVADIRRDAIIAETDSIEKNKVDMAVAGNSFLNFMLPTMAGVQFLWIAMTPVAALVMIVIGRHALAYLGKYLLFGVWAMTWLPVASICNFFTQLATQYALNNGPGANFVDFMTPEAFSGIYNVTSTWIATGSFLLASTPLISLALLSGNFFSMSQVAQNASGKNAYDGKNLAPDTQRTGSLSETTGKTAGATFGASNQISRAEHAAAPVITSGESRASISSVISTAASGIRTSMATEISALRSSETFAGYSAGSDEMYASSDAAHQDYRISATRNVLKGIGANVAEGSALENAVAGTLAMGLGNKEVQAGIRNTLSDADRLAYDNIVSRLEGTASADEATASILKDYVSRQAANASLESGNRKRGEDAVRKVDSAAKDVSTAVNASNALNRGSTGGQSRTSNLYDLGTGLAHQMRGGNASRVVGDLDSFFQQAEAGGFAKDQFRQMYEAAEKSLPASLQGDARKAAALVQTLSNIESAEPNDANGIRAMDDAGRMLRYLIENQGRSDLSSLSTGRPSTEYDDAAAGLTKLQSATGRPAGGVSSGAVESAADGVTGKHGGLQNKASRLFNQLDDAQAEQTAESRSRYDGQRNKVLPELSGELKSPATLQQEGATAHAQSMLRGTESKQQKMVNQEYASGFKSDEYPAAYGSVGEAIRENLYSESSEARKAGSDKLDELFGFGRDGASVENASPELAKFAGQYASLREGGVPAAWAAAAIAKTDRGLLIGMNPGSEFAQLMGEHKTAMTMGTVTAMGTTRAVGETVAGPLGKNLAETAQVAAVFAGIAAGEVSKQQLDEYANATLNRSDYSEDSGQTEQERRFIRAFNADSKNDDWGGRAAGALIKAQKAD